MPADRSWELLAERAVVAAERLASAAHRIAGEMERARSYRAATASNALHAATEVSSTPFVTCVNCGCLLTSYAEAHDCKKFQEEQMKRNERAAANHV